ncbi:hypothetical protein CCP3SC1_820010 [Gammaproteobacteria bacterium]
MPAMDLNSDIPYQNDGRIELQATSDYVTMDVITYDNNEVLFWYFNTSHLAKRLRK